MKKSVNWHEKCSIKTGWFEFVFALSPWWRDYDSKYNVQEFIELTDKQKEALNPSRKTKPAGYEAKSSSIDGFINNLR